ncbi:hypothetical protein OG921_23990 [Aldersonia sp. NBC_00410]|uniref:hypothetical protein n=1 Tax=Aldersonia sp. NBC_00410 TaxID=2975954 RepID=UPI00224F0A85|nr:hypothetical protein [Aldersonia sp. NBC_00410]MCX5046237.1 hypothetical protein [Aldersonia sp. NBC_00410]
MAEVCSGKEIGFGIEFPFGGLEFATQHPIRAHISVLGNREDLDGQQQISSRAVECEPADAVLARACANLAA